RLQRAASRARRVRHRDGIFGAKEFCMKWLRRIAAVIGLMLVVFVVACAWQILNVQYGCKPEGSAANAGKGFGIDDAKYPRAEGDSFLTYPEWYIVYAYSDLAGVTRAASESSFDYF